MQNPTTNTPEVQLLFWDLSQEVAEVVAPVKRAAKKIIAAAKEKVKQAFEFVQSIFDWDNVFVPTPPPPPIPESKICKIKSCNSVVDISYNGKPLHMCSWCMYEASIWEGVFDRFLGTKS